MADERQVFFRSHPAEAHAASVAVLEGTTLADMIKENLVAERIAIESYTEIINYLEGKDPTSHKLMREILAKEEEHAEDMNTLLEQLGKKGEPAKAAPGKKSASGKHG